ncbi:fanconi anemia group J protein, partial [Tanacetum coccineum]
KNNGFISKADPEAMDDPFGRGSGFVPEAEPSGNMMPTLSDTNNKTLKMKRGPEDTFTDKSSDWRIPENKLPCAYGSSGSLSCLKRFLLLNAPMIKAHPSVRKGGCYEVHDIEDLVKVGEMVQGCSYFGAQGMAEVADIVFCPYNYIINPQIRKAMEISVEANFIILVEAQSNIEDIARDAGSIDVGEDVLFQLQTELDDLCQSKRVAEPDQLGIYRPLYEMIEGIISWIRRRKKSLGKHSFQHNASCWTAEKALRELEEASISKQCFPSLQECATQAIRIAADADPDIDHLSGMASTVIEGLFSSLTYFFSGNGKHICDYQLALQCQTTKSEAGLQLALQCQTIKSEAGLAAEESPCTFSLWCLNPSLVFKNMADTALSDLSPMSSFQSELGVQFGTSLEAPHVINVDSQLWAGVIHSGPNHYPLNASYKTSESFDFQDAVGASLEEICKVVPGGCLVSEGIDFSDENARAVIIVGIPFPNVYDIKVSEKKKYNDAYKSSKGLLSGNEWYCQQAFRALNQAAGRCIRHRLDYGAIIFLDERFRQERNLAYLSKWLRNSIRQYDDFGQSLEGLKSFFRDIKVESKASSTQLVDVKPIDVEESENWFTEMKNSKHIDDRWFQSPPSMNISHDDFELTVVAETPNYNEPLTVKKEPISEAYSTTVESVSEVDFSHSTIIQTNFPHQQLPHSFTSPCSTSDSAFNTPNKQHISHNKSPLYSSVNSHVHKRKKNFSSETVKNGAV